MPSLRPVLYIIGVLLIALGGFTAIPALIDFSAIHSGWQVFVASSLVCLFFGGILILATHSHAAHLSLRQAFLFTFFSWICVSLFATLPLYFSALELSFTDAYFETVSGLTATGATVLSGLDDMPRNILLWRALLQWMGGIGIIGMAIAVMPMLQVGGTQLFRMESSDRSEKVMPRQQKVFSYIAAIYLLLTLFCAFGYWLFGMTGFEAISHAMTTVSTGGYSTSDQSIGYFESSSIRQLAIVFMVLGALPFVLYIAVIQGKAHVLWRDAQVRKFLGFLTFVILCLTIWIFQTQDIAWGDALERSAFHVVSVVTTTGYATHDYSAWGSFAFALFFCLTFVGGCNGSTAGGIKIFRFQIMYESLRAQMHRLLYPHGAYVQNYNHRPLSKDVSDGVMAFMFVFVVVFVGLVLGLLFTGLDFTTSFSAAAASLANVGPALGPVIGPAGNFSSLPELAKYLCMFAMFLGRLELFTVMVLLSPRFWRQ